jgi:AAA+ ATPase superfamily predicted ATPase
MDELIGRERQLKMLGDAWAGSGSSFIPIYGRRRVGKTELILRFLREKPALYYLGKKAPAGLQIREFLEMAAVVLGEPLLAAFPAERWSAALDAVMTRRPPGKKIALAFDEFQWMVEASPELPSLLQERWDREWQHSGDVMLILCGSYVGSWSARCWVGAVRCSAGGRRRSCSGRWTIGQRPASIPATRSWTARGRTSSAVESRSTCVPSRTAGPSR